MNEHANEKPECSAKYDAMMKRTYKFSFMGNCKAKRWLEPLTIDPV